MAVIWSKQIDDCRYEVRRAGHSVRLYTNNIFHSQWNARTPVTGALWELLLIPAFFHDQPTALDKVLALGVGGGAVINLLNTYLHPRNIVGVDLDKNHLDIARHFFNVTTKNTRLLQAEAQQWVNGATSNQFDLIIEDLFMPDIDGEPARAIVANASWMRQLGRLLAPGGLLVMNFDSHSNLRDAVKLSTTKRHFKNAYNFSSDSYHNAIGLFSKAKLSRNTFNSNISQISDLDSRKKSCKLHYRLTKIM